MDNNFENGGKKILVTGGSGFIGAEIVNQLYSMGGWNITVLDVMTEQIHGKDWRQSYLYKTIEGKCRFIKGSVCDLPTVQDAISDLICDEKLKSSIPESDYQRSCRKGRTPDIHGTPISVGEKLANTELPNVTEVVAERFSLFQQGESGSNLRKRVKTEGIDISEKPSLISLCSEKLKKSADEVISLFRNPNATEDEIDVLLTKKNIRQRWSANQPSATIVSIADDYISPWEARTFSVREMARCQSFDDSFEFLGKRTTGGLLRRVEVPQYTQVGNAVPPLLAKAIVGEIKKCI